MSPQPEEIDGWTALKGFVTYLVIPHVVVLTGLWLFHNAVDKPTPSRECVKWAYRDKTVHMYEGEVVWVDEYDRYCVRHK